MPALASRVASRSRNTGLLISLLGFVLVVAACASVEDSGVPPSGAAAPESVPIEDAPVTDPPDIDTSVSAVPIADVYFDTFDGGAVPLSESTPELRRRLLDAIPPIDAPVYGNVATGDWLLPDDLVLGYVGGDQAYAYPFKILNFHEIVNDVIDGVPVLVSYCPLCGSAIVYDRRLDGDVLSFGNTSALYESDLVMVDRATGSYWWQVAGTAIVGPLSGAALEPFPSAVATWDDWVTTHPDTLVLTQDTGFDRPYTRDVFSTYSEIIDDGQFFFPVGEAALDSRLRASALVVGVAVGEEMRAYPVEGLVDPINDTIDDAPVVVFPTSSGAAVFSPRADDTILVFERLGEAF
ncbi:MAG: DUF3179 domain-containing protein, partial [Actinomycetota bacterium]|nr:DUF3179 domain-containing protein [Actinomycetota bacterium]